MTHLTHAEEVAVPVYITQEARQIAEQFAQQQPTPKKAQQVQLNTLAVCAVNNYFKILGIPADPSNCDSWNPFMRMTTNVADLEVRGRGRIECRPLPQIDHKVDSICYVPTEVQRDRLAYLVVHIEPEQPEAWILGFVEQVTSEALPLSQLRPIAELPAYLDQSKSNPVAEHITQLTRWLQGQIESGWKTLDEVLGTTTPEFQWRSSDSKPAPSALSRVMRGKVLELSTPQGPETVALIAELNANGESDDLDIKLKIAPAREQAFLPVGLVMTVVDAAGEPVMHAQARDENRTVELGFRAELGDRFHLKIQLRDVVITESFVV